MKYLRGGFVLCDIDNSEVTVKSPVMTPMQADILRYVQTALSLSGAGVTVAWLRMRQQQHKTKASIAKTDVDQFGINADLIISREAELAKQNRELWQQIGSLQGEIKSLNTKVDFMNNEHRQQMTADYERHSREIQQVRDEKHACSSQLQAAGHWVTILKMQIDQELKNQGKPEIYKAELEKAAAEFQKKLKEAGAL